MKVHTLTNTHICKYPNTHTYTKLMHTHIIIILYIKQYMFNCSNQNKSSYITGLIHCVGIFFFQMHSRKVCRVISKSNQEKFSNLTSVGQTGKLYLICNLKHVIYNQLCWMIVMWTGMKACENVQKSP